MRCLTTGTIPGKAINDDKLNEQETFKEQELEPHIEEAKAGKRALFFGDAAHFVHGAFIAKLCALPGCLCQHLRAVNVSMFLQHKRPLAHFFFMFYHSFMSQIENRLVLAF